MGILLAHHIASGFLIGSIFLGVGSVGNRPFDNVRLIMSNIVFFMYTYMMCNVLLCKLRKAKAAQFIEPRRRNHTNLNVLF